MKIVVIVLLALLTAVPAHAENAKLQAFVRGFYAQREINKARAASPYRKYAKTYKQLYQSGQMSQAEYTQRMIEVEHLEMEYQQNITNSVRSAINQGQRSNQINEMIHLQRTATHNPELGIINGRSRVTDQFGNTLGYVEEPR